MFVIVTYDTPSNSRRRRMARRTLDFIRRVQKSVYEGDLSGDQLKELKSKLVDLVDLSADSVRIYVIPDDFIPRIETIGAPPLERDPEAWIVTESDV